MSREQWEAIVEHARSEAPNECCGFMRARDGVVDEVYPAENVRKSRYAYELDPQSLLRASDLNDEGWEVGIYHSHPKSGPLPSQTDINLAMWWPDFIHLIVSLERDPVVRAWRIDNGHVDEEPIDVT
jgi:proteasome lid subunit RPN8/RPN11